MSDEPAVEPVVDAQATDTTVDTGEKVPWYGEGITDADDIGWIQNKGYDSVGALLKATRGLEKHFGVPADQIIKMPGADDPDGMRDVWTKMGCPPEPKDYVFDAPEGTELNDGLVDSWRAFAHENGLPSGTATDAFKWYNEQQGLAQTALDEAKETAFQAEVVELKNACGAKYDEVVDLADRAALTLGLSDEEFSNLTATAGVKRVTEMFAKIGGMMSEDNLAEGSSRGGYGQTHEQIVNDQNTLLGDISSDPVRLAAYQNASEKHPNTDFTKMQNYYKQIADHEDLTK